jgi:hypothetical protein
MKDKKITIETDFIGKIEFSNVLIKKVSGNVFRSFFFYMTEKLKLVDNYDKKYDMIIIVKRCRDK